MWLEALRVTVLEIIYVAQSHSPIGIIYVNNPRGLLAAVFATMPRWVLCWMFSVFIKQSEECAYGDNPNPRQKRVYVLMNAQEIGVKVKIRTKSRRPGFLTP